jgi:hypothetical protein
MPEEELVLKIADIYLSCQSIHPHLLLDTESSLEYFCTSLKGQNSDYTITYQQVESILLTDSHLVFTGEPEENQVLNYRWYVYNVNDEIVIKVDFKDHPQIKNIAAFVSEKNSQVRIDVVLNKKTDDSVKIDPLIHPLGSLLLLYLMHWKKGLLIHASGVSVEGAAYLFTGVSGIGKSTMARLWAECGAQVLNDDRLVLRLMDNRVNVYNNPMPHYKQYPHEAVLKKIFLLRQSTENYIQPLKGVMAYSRVLGNFIQQFYNKQMVQNHLVLVEQILSKVEVYEVGFKPDHDIVAMIKSMDRNEQ